MYSELGFMFNGVHSSAFEVIAVHFGGGGKTEYTTATRELLEDKVVGTYEKISYGDNPSTFSINMDIVNSSNQTMSVNMRRSIKAWLMQPQYQRLYLDEHEDIGYKVKVQQMQEIRIGNVVKGFNIEFVSQSAYAYSLPQTIEHRNFNFVESEVHSPSNINDYYYPERMVIKSDTATELSIINYSDDDREFRVELSAGEIVVIDNKRKIISSNLKSRKLGDFNGKWLRFNDYTNFLRFIVRDGGTVEFIEIDCEFPVNI